MLSYFIWALNSIQNKITLQVKKKKKKRSIDDYDNDNVRKIQFKKNEKTK